MKENKRKFKNTLNGQIKWYGHDSRINTIQWPEANCS